MCRAAIYWAKIPKMYYGCTRIDAANADFADEKIYKLMKKKLWIKMFFLKNMTERNVLKFSLPGG